jgi:nucleotide-binding universal stress UspA family protein
MGRSPPQFGAIIKLTKFAVDDGPHNSVSDLIVMASHGRHGISAIVLGSETVKVLTHCKIPVLVHR